jgi:hypothetical protein
MSPDRELGRRMRAGAGHFRVVGEHFGKTIAPQKIRNDDILERIPFERDALQRG